MAMLPEGFKSFSTQGSYESSEKVTTEAPGAPPTHNAEGYKQDFRGRAPEGTAYHPILNDAAKGSEAVKGDKNETQADRETSLAITMPAAYSRDWSGK